MVRRRLRGTGPPSRTRGELRWRWHSRERARSRGNDGPASWRLSRSCRCRRVKSGVSSSFLPEKTNRHRISPGFPGENPPYGILEGEGETRSSIEPAGRPFPTRQFIILGKSADNRCQFADNRCQFIISGNNELDNRCQFIISGNNELTPTAFQLTPTAFPSSRPNCKART